MALSGVPHAPRRDGKVQLCRRHRDVVDRRAQQARSAKLQENAERYPRTRWCPDGHGSTTFASPLEEQLARHSCAQCGSPLVDEEPEQRRHESQFVGLPALPQPHHAELPRVVSALQSGRHVYLAGTPGTGKSELSRQAAEALGLPLHVSSCDSSMTRSAFFGFVDAAGHYHRTPLREALEEGGVFLLDEIDNGNPSLLAALNSAMSNAAVAFPDATVPVHEDFRVIATANTWGTGPTSDFVGRLRVDPATLDRFARVYVGIDERLEDELATVAAGGDAALAAAAVRAVRSIRRSVEAEGLKIIVSPRASMQAAALTARGWSLRDALMTTAVGTLEARRAASLIEESQ